MRVRIGIDLDGTLADFSGAFETLMEERDLEHTPEDRVKLFRSGDKIVHEIYTDPILYTIMQPFANRVAGVTQLASNPDFDVYIITTSPSIPVMWTRKVEWVHRHIPCLSRKIIMAGDKSMVQLTCLLDDHVHRYTKAPQQTVPWIPVLVDSPSNSCVSSEYTRIREEDWRDLGGYLREVISQRTANGRLHPPWSLWA